MRVVKSLRMELPQTCAKFTLPGDPAFHPCLSLRCPRQRYSSSSASRVRPAPPSLSPGGPTQPFPPSHVHVGPTCKPDSGPPLSHSILTAPSSAIVDLSDICHSCLLALTASKRRVQHQSALSVDGIDTIGTLHNLVRPWPSTGPFRPATPDSSDDPRPTNDLSVTRRSRHHTAQPLCLPSSTSHHVLRTASHNPWISPNLPIHDFYQIPPPDPTLRRRGIRQQHSLRPLPHGPLDQLQLDHLLQGCRRPVHLQN